MLEIPNLNVIYEDDTGTLLLHDIGGEGKMFVLHAEVIPSTNRKLLEHYMSVMDALFKALKERGVSVLKTWVMTDEQIRYAIFFGFDGSPIKEVVIEGYTGGPTIYELEKVL